MTVRREGPGAGRLAQALRDLENVEGKVGWFETAFYPDGTPVAYVAAIHEFGTDKIDARPFMRPAVAQHGAGWIKLFEGASREVLAGRLSAAQALELVTEAAAGNVAEGIQAVTNPALSPVTVKRKGFDKPLIDTGQMFQSVTGVVERT